MRQRRRVGRRDAEVYGAGAGEGGRGRRPAVAVGCFFTVNVCAECTRLTSVLDWYGRPNAVYMRQGPDAHISNAQMWTGRKCAASQRAEQAHVSKGRTYEGDEALFVHSRLSTRNMSEPPTYRRVS